VARSEAPKRGGGFKREKQWCYRKGHVGLGWRMISAHEKPSEQKKKNGGGGKRKEREWDKVHARVKERGGALNQDFAAA